MRGKLVHTNEILVLLGDNWFTERSAKQAGEIIERRLGRVIAHLDGLNKEKAALNDQLEWTENLLKVN